MKSETGLDEIMAQNEPARYPFLCGVYSHRSRLDCCVHASMRLLEASTSKRIHTMVMSRYQQICRKPVSQRETPYVGVRCRGEQFHLVSCWVHFTLPLPVSSAELRE